MDANFLNLHIDKGTKTHGDKQLYLITDFIKQPKLFTATVECNGTVVKEPKTEKAILFLNFNSCSMVRPLVLVHFQPCCTLTTYNGTDVRNVIRLNVHATAE